MLWVGLTGGIASGKSSVAQILTSLGVAVVGADQLAHEAMGPGSIGAQEIRKTFGETVFRPDGSIDRAKLGAIVFSDKSAELRSKLEAIIHPAVRMRAEEEKSRLEARGDAMAVYEIPLLFEKKLEDNFDLIVTVAVSSEVQVERLMERSGLSKSEAYDRIGSQLSQAAKIQASDFVIWNDGDLAYLKAQVEKMVRAILGSGARM